MGQAMIARRLLEDLKTLDMVEEKLVLPGTVVRGLEDPGSGSRKN